MLRIAIAIAATMFIVNASQACTGTCGHRDPIVAQQRAKCQSLIVPKSLTGVANKGEWSKCMRDPDNYK